MKYVCDIVVKRFTFAISSPDEFYFLFRYIPADRQTNIEMSESESACLYVCLMFVHLNAPNGGNFGLKKVGGVPKLVVYL